MPQNDNFFQSPAGCPNSSVVCDTPTGHGSVGTKIRTWTSANTVTVGTDITYASDTTNGDTFTINTTGIYHLVWNDLNSGGATALGFSVNSAQLTTNIDAITKTTRIGITGTTTLSNNAVAVARLTAGSIVRCHDKGVCDGNTDVFFFRIVRIA